MSLNSVSTLNPTTQRILEQRTTQSASPAQQNQTIKPDAKIKTKQDSFVKNGIEKFKSLDNKKKAGILIGAAAVAGAIVFALAKGKNVALNFKAKNIQVEAKNIQVEAKNIQAEAGNIQEEAKNIIQKGQKKLEEVTNLFNQGKEKACAEFSVDGKTIKFSEDGLDTVMREFNGETLQRESRFVGNSVIIEEYAEGTNESIGFKFKDGKLSTYAKKLDCPPDGNEKYQDYFDFDEDGKLSTYAKKLDCPPDGNEKYQDLFDFYEDGKLAAYAKEIEYSPDGNEKYQDYFNFWNDGKLRGYAKEYKSSPDDNGKYQDYFIFYKEDGKLCTYSKEIECSPDGNRKYQDYFSFYRDGKLADYAEKKE